MTELSSPTLPVEGQQINVPTIEEVFETVRRLNYYEVTLWTAHHDAQRPNVDGEHILQSFPAQDAEKLFNGITTLRDAEGHYDIETFPWLPRPEQIIHKVVNAAESIRRGLSDDAYAVSDSLPQPTSSDRSRDQGLLRRTQARLRATLRGSYPSVADQMVRHAEMSGDYKELIPLESQREYQEVTPQDIQSLEQEEPGNFIKLSADVLSPIRNEHSQLSEETLSSLAALISKRKDEIGATYSVLLINCWRLAQQNGCQDIAQSIESQLGDDSPLKHFMELYESKETVSPNPDTMKANATRLFDEYIDRGGKPGDIDQSGTDKPKVRMRLNPEALWSIAMRDGGFIRSGDEGTARETGRGYEGNYAFIRRYVESTLFGDAALDEVKAVPIVYGYFANQATEQTVALQSMARIYGSIELVFKDDVPAEKRVLYGDSMNAIAVEAGQEKATPELIQKVLGERVIAEKDATALAHVISALHGNVKNTEFNPSANPYIECLLRGRLNLADCEEIRVPAKVYDGNTELMQKIEQMFGVTVSRVE